MTDFHLPKEELKVLNRGLITIIRKSPFFEWVELVSGPLEEEERTSKAHNSYLIRDNIGSGVLENIVQRYFEVIYEQELFEAWEVEEEWPKDRSWESFNLWFDWHYSEMVWDLEKGILELE